MHPLCQIARQVPGGIPCFRLGADGRPMVERPALNSRPGYEVDRGAAIGGIGPELSSSLPEACVDGTRRQFGTCIESCRGGGIAEDVIRISHVVGSVAFI
jgi:hypothetical protein